MELLSPAGNLELALAAFDGGADAVYCGLAGAFNARMRAENFTLETLGKLLRYARENQKRVYLTFNTLIKENELGPMFETLADVAKLAPDALIVQDAGVIHTVKKYFPQLKLHASTQMGIHNSAGVKVMENLGVSRVILERQITLEELKKIAASTKIELEVFIHGSLCCSLSGRCLFSHYLYGQSGNRGQCKQPCRRRFNAGKEEGYFLSPGDLYGLPLLDEFDAMGIASVKIEGRLRSPDYVWKTARAYRTLIDAPPEHRSEAAAEAENILNTALSRRKTLGFYDFPSRIPLIDNRTSGAFGALAATVETSTRRGLIVTTHAPLHLGDRLRFQPPGCGDGETFSLSTMESAPGVKVLKVRAKSRIFIPGKFSALPKWQLLKIGENGFDFSRQAANLPTLRYPLDMKITFNAQSCKLTTCGHEIELPCDFAPAEKYPLQPSTVQQVFSEALPEPWCAGKITIKIDGDFFVPAAELKKLRREIWARLIPALDLEKYFSGYTRKLENFFSDVSAPLPEKNNFSLPDNREKTFTIPGFIPETELPLWQEKIHAAYTNCCRIFFIEHWHGFELLRNYSDITMICCFPLPIANSRAAKLLAENGCCAAVYAPESDSADRTALSSHSPLNIIPPMQKTPLLVSRIPLKSGKWLDRNGKKYTVIRENNMSFLFDE